MVFSFHFGFGMVLPPCGDVL
jgi:hypothetical protein